MRFRNILHWALQGELRPFYLLTKLHLVTSFSRHFVLWDGTVALWVTSHLQAWRSHSHPGFQCVEFLCLPLRAWTSSRFPTINSSKSCIMCDCVVYNVPCPGSPLCFLAQCDCALVKQLWNFDGWMPVNVIVPFTVDNELKMMVHKEYVHLYSPSMQIMFMLREWCCFAWDVLPKVPLLSLHTNKETWYASML